MHNRLVVLRPAGVLLALAALAGCGNANANANGAAPGPPGVAMIVNGTNIPFARYEHLVSATSAKFDAKGIGPNTTTAEGRARAKKIQSGALQELADEQIVIGMAAARHVTVDSGEIDQSITTLRGTLGGQAVLDQRLQQDYETGDDLRNLIHINRLQFKLRQQDPGYDNAFKQAVATAHIAAFVAPCDQQHDYPHCAGA